MDDARLVIEVSAKEILVPLPSFLAITGHTQSILHSADDALHAGDKDKVRWGIESASKTSPLSVVISAEQPCVSERISEDIQVCVEGLNALDTGANVPDYWNDGMLEHAKDIVATLGDGIAALSFSCGETIAKPTQRVAAHVDQLLHSYKQDGLLDGYLERVSAHSGLTFAIFDVVSGKPVPCTFTPDLRDTIKELLYDRVKVRGLVQYSRLGKPMKIEAKEVEPFPEAGQGLFEIPPLNITGGMDAEDYIERMRENA